MRLCNFPPVKTSPVFHADFMSGALDSRLTFSRASNGGYLNSSGVLTQATTNAPRFDYSPSTLGSTYRFARALANVKAGTGSARILALGDSTTAGYLSSLSNVQVSTAYPEVLAALLNSAGIPARSDGVMGTGSADWAYNVNPLITAYTGAWTNSYTSGSFISTIGGWQFQNAGAAGNFTFTNNRNADTLKIWVWDNAASVMGVSVDGGSVSNQTLTGSGAFKPITIALGSAGIHTINLTWVSGGNLFIDGWEFSNSSLNEVIILNAGWVGAKSSDLAYNSFSCSPATAISTLNPDLTVLDAGINDAINGVSTTVYLANITTITTNAIAAGGSLLMVSPNDTGGGGHPYEGTITTFASANGLPVFDLFTRWGLYTVAEANGWLSSDATHPTVAGYADVASGVNAVITGWSLTGFAAKGLLIEEQRANMFGSSNSFGGYNATVTTSSAMSPDGTLDASLVTATAGLQDHYVNSFNQYPGQSSGTLTGAYTYSFYAKAGTKNLVYAGMGSLNTFQATYNLSTGVISGLTSGYTGDMVYVGNGWWRCSLTSTFAAAATYLSIWVLAGYVTALGTETITVFGSQFEAGSFPTSYIPTTSNGVTRAADNLYTTSLAWFNTAVGTFKVEHSMAQVPASGTYPGVAGFSDGTNANLIATYINSGGPRIGSFSRAGGVTQYDSGNSGGSTYTAGMIWKQALAYSTSNTTAYANSVQQVSGVYTIPPMTRLDLGSDTGGSPLNGWLRNFNYWNYALSASQLQKVTT